MKNNFWLGPILLIVIAQIYILSRIKFTAWPEMLLWPYLMGSSWMPYENISIAHTPVLLFFLTMFFKIAGSGILQLKLFTWGLILVLDLLVYWVTSKLFNKKVALISLCGFVLWQMFFEGNGLWFDLAMSAFALGIFYQIKKKNYFRSGVFWALAFLTKQTAFWFLIPVVYEVWHLNKKMLTRESLNFAKGSIATMVIAGLAIMATGILPDFLTWTVKFGIFELPKAVGQVQLPGLKSLIISSMPFSIMILLLFGRMKKNTDLVLWAIAGAMGIYPRFEYFHFQPAVPFLALSTGLLMSQRIKKNFFGFSRIIYLAVGFYFLAGFFMKTYNEGTRFYETDVSNVSDYINNKTKDGEKIFVMNYWDNVYTLSHTLPAIDPWVPQLSWYLEREGVQREMVADLSESSPRYILQYPYTNVGASSYVPDEVFRYVSENYHQIDRVDGILILERNK